MPLHIQRRMRELRTIFIKSLRTRSLFPLSITKKCLKWATLRRVFWLVSGKRGCVLRIWQKLPSALSFVVEYAMACPASS